MSEEHLIEQHIENFKKYPVQIHIYSDGLKVKVELWGNDDESLNLTFANALMQDKKLRKISVSAMYALLEELNTIINQKVNN